MSSQSVFGDSGRAERPESPVFILGYGNPDRQDDGVAWHVLAGVARQLGCPVPEEPGAEFEPVEGGPRFEFVLQLTPELAEEISGYAHVCFVDAHTGAVPKDLQFLRLTAEVQASPFTHHMTPQTLLALAETLYGHRPSAYLVSVRGYHFGFEPALSPATASLAQQAVEWVAAWAVDPEHPPSHDT